MLTIYSKENCPWCVKAKDAMTQCGIEYEEINIEQDKGARDFLMHAVLKTVPQIFYDDEYIGGYEELADYLLEQGLT